MEDKEVEIEMEKFSLPVFGDSPGGSPSVTPPSGHASPRRRGKTEVQFILVDFDILGPKTQTHQFALEVVLYIFLQTVLT